MTIRISVSSDEIIGFPRVAGVGLLLIIGLFLRLDPEMMVIGLISWISCGAAPFYPASQLHAYAKRAIRTARSVSSVEKVNVRRQSCGFSGSSCRPVMERASSESELANLIRKGSTGDQECSELSMNLSRPPDASSNSAAKSRTTAVSSSNCLRQIRTWASYELNAGRNFRNMRFAMREGRALSTCMH